MKKIYAFLLSAAAVASASAADFTKLKSQSAPAAVAPLANSTAIDASRAVSCYYSGDTYESLADHYAVVSNTETAVYDSNLGETSATDGWVFIMDFANDYTSPVALQTGTYKIVADPYPADPAAFSY